MHSVQTQQPVHAWNYGMKKMLRWVNRSARGIALPYETWQNTETSRVCLIFPDTHDSRRQKPVYL